MGGHAADEVVNRLRAEYEEDGKGPLFEALKGQLDWRTRGTALRAARPSDSVLARRPSRRPCIGCVKRYGELLREEVAETVTSADEVEDEICATVRRVTWTR